MDQIEIETRMQVQERLRAAREFGAMAADNVLLRFDNELLKGGNEFLGRCVEGYTSRNLGVYAAKIERMKDRAYRRETRRARWVRVFSRVRDYEAVMWIIGTTIVFLSFLYWLAVR